MSWKSVELGNLCDVLDSKRKPITKRDRTEGEYPYYGATGIVDYVGNYIFDEKLVLIGEDGAKWGSGEKTAFIADGKYWVNNHAHVIKPKRDLLLDEWLVYYFYYKDLKEFVTGLTVPKLNQGQLRIISIPLPPLATQQKIVTKLDAIFAEIDKATAAAEANAKNAEALFQSYLTEIFEKLINKNNSVNLKNICEFENGDRGKNYPSKQHQVESGIPFINAGDLKDGWSISRSGMAFITEERFNLLGAGKVKLGDLLFCLRGSLGKCGIVEDIEVGAIASSLVIIRPLANLSISKFIYWFLSSSICACYIDATKGGAAQPNLSAKSVMNFQIPMIDSLSQVEIVKQIDSFYAQTLKIKESYIEKVKELNLLKQSILQQAFSGELVKE